MALNTHLNVRLLKLAGTTIVCPFFRKYLEYPIMYVLVRYSLLLPQLCVHSVVYILWIPYHVCSCLFKACWYHNCVCPFLEYQFKCSSVNECLVPQLCLSISLRISRLPYHICFWSVNACWYRSYIFPFIGEVLEFWLYCVWDIVAPLCVLLVNCWMR